MAPSVDAKVASLTGMVDAICGSNQEIPSFEWSEKYGIMIAPNRLHRQGS
jgi:hypothetical protein